MNKKSLNNSGNLSYHMVKLSTLKVEILSIYLLDYSKSFYLREIAKRIGKSHVGLIPHLNELVKDKILVVNQVGRSKLYSLNKSNYLVCDYLIILEKLKTLDFLNNNLLLKKFYFEFDNLNLDFILFGSFAKGNFNSESDVDILVIGEVSSFLEKKIKDFGKIYSKKFHITKASIEDFYGSSRENPLIVEVLKNHIIISGFERFTKERWNKWKI